MSYVTRLSEMNMLEWMLLPYTEILGKPLFLTMIFALTISIMYLKNQTYFVPFIMIFWGFMMIGSVTDINLVFASPVLGWIVALFMIGFIALIVRAYYEFKRSI